MINRFSQGRCPRFASDRNGWCRELAIRHDQMLGYLSGLGPGQRTEAVLATVCLGHVYVVAAFSTVSLKQTETPNVRVNPRVFVPLNQA